MNDFVQRMTDGGFGGGMRFTDIADDMQPIVHDIVESAAKLQDVFYLELTIFNRNTKVEYPPTMITRMDIVENFEIAIGDMIEVDLLVDPKLKELLMVDFRDLTAHLKAYIYDVNTQLKSNRPVFEVNWTVLIKDRADYSLFRLPKQGNGVSGSIVDLAATVPMTIQLYNPGTLTLRNRKTTGIFRDCTVAKLIGFLATIFGVKNLDMTPPHNTLSIENLMIEPMHYCNDVFDYIQRRYGIYREGVSIYYYGKDEQNSKLVVYPKFDYCPSPKTKEAVEILYIGQGNMINGTNNFKRYPRAGIDISLNGKTMNVSGTKILCNNILSSTSLGEMGADNIGTQSVMFNANRTIDRWRSIKVSPDNLAIPEHKGDILDGMKNTTDFTGFATAQYNPRYDVSYNNAYNVAEILASVNCRVVTMRCMGMEPWLIEPGQLVYLVYSDLTSNTVVKVPGICSNITYSFIVVKTSRPGAPAFECQATLTLKQKLTQ